MSKKYITYNHIIDGIHQVAQIDKTTFLYHLLNLAHPHSYLDTWLITQKHNDWKIPFHVDGYKKVEIDLSKTSVEELDLSDYLNALADVSYENGIVYKIIKKIAIDSMKSVIPYVDVCYSSFSETQMDFSPVLKMISDMIDDNPYNKKHPLPAGSIKISCIFKRALCRQDPIENVLNLVQFNDIKSEIIAILSLKTAKRLSFFRSRDDSIIALYKNIIALLNSVPAIPPHVMILND